MASTNLYGLGPAWGSPIKSATQSQDAYYQMVKQRLDSGRRVTARDMAEVELSAPRWNDDRYEYCAMSDTVRKKGQAKPHTRMGTRPEHKAGERYFKTFHEELQFEVNEWLPSV